MIAISYRREDSLPVAGRLYDRLQAEFGKGNVFMDFDSIPYGVDFRDHIKQMIDRSKVLVAMIGPDWIGRRRHRGRRIDDPTDFVRLEIAYALERNLPIIPILVSNTRMPGPEELPKDIEALAFRNALNLDAGIDFHHHAERLVAAINRLLIVPPPPIVPVQKTPSNQVGFAQSSLAAPETQLAEPLAPAIPEVIVRPLPPLKPSPLESAGRPSAPAGSAAAEPIARTQPIVFQKAKTLGTRIAVNWQHTRKMTSAAMLRFGHSVNSIKTSVAGGFRSLIDYLHRHARTIVVSTCFVVAVMSATVALYWAFHSPTFRNWVFVNSSPLRKLTQILSARSTPQPTQSPFAVPQVGENAPSISSTPPATSTPAPPRGVLTIDSTPQGQVFELIGSDGSHRIGTTPITLDNLPVGYAQIIFKREGFIDHSETVWLTSNTQPAVRWNFPNDTRARDSTQQNAEISPPASPMNPSAPHDGAWQAWIGDFVKEFVAVNQSQDANATVDFYAPNVDYFGGRGKDHAFILRDVQKYNVDWPARRDAIDGDIRVEEKVPNQQYQASFKVNLYAENRKTNDWTKGQVATTLDVSIIDGVPRIVAINQRKLQRPQHGKGKGPRPPEMEAALRPIDPKKFTKVFVKKYGFSALLPADLFPDAETKLADGNTDHVNSGRGCAMVSFSALHDSVRKVYDQRLNQFRAAANRRNIDYKVLKDAWFVVSGGSKTTGYYVKGVKHGDDVFVMELEYGGALCNIPNAMLTEISHAFDGSVDSASNPSNTAGPTDPAAPLSTPNQHPTQPEEAKVDATPFAGAQSSTESPAPQGLTRVYVKCLDCSVLIPTEIFPDATKLSNSEFQNRIVSNNGRVWLEFSHDPTSASLAQSYNTCATETVVAGKKVKLVHYKVLKDSWFVVSGTDPSGDGGFYWKGVKRDKGGVSIMRLTYPENSSPLTIETLTAMSKSFTGM
jgi:hypothetical protein